MGGGRLGEREDGKQGMTREDRWRGKEVKEDKGKGAEAEEEREDKNQSRGKGQDGQGAARWAGGCKMDRAVLPASGHQKKLSPLFEITLLFWLLETAFLPFLLNL